MATHVCPWWGGWFIDNRFRRLLHKPEIILAPYIQPGMTVMDFGCGMGIFSMAMAAMVGEEGRVIAVDLQGQMLQAVQKRAERAGLADRVQTHQCERDSVGVSGPVDFVLAFWSAHEAPNFQKLVAELHQCLVDGGRLLLVEPRGHVMPAAFDKMIQHARKAGLEYVQSPKVRLSHTGVFIKQQNPGAARS